MSSSYGNITCPKCGHTENSTTAKKCEICGFTLQRSGLPVPAIVIGALALLGITAGGFYTFKDQILGSSQVDSSNQNTTISNSGENGSSTNEASDIDTTNLLSRGERLLVTENNNPDKLAGIQAYAAGDYRTAITKFESALAVQGNDPETLIYLNNSRLADKPHMTIATVVPITNSTSSALERLRGVAQAQDEAVKASVPFQVLIADDANDSNQAQAIAKVIAADENILAVIGHGTSGTTLAAAPIYVENQLTMVAGTATSTDFVKIPKGSDGTQYVFRTIASDQFTGTVLARHFLTKMNKKNAVVFYTSQSSYSNSLKTAFMTTLGLEGGQVVQEVDLSQTAAASTPINSSAEVIVLLPDSQTLTAAIDVAKANANRLPILAGDAAYVVEALQQGGSAVNGMVLAVPWHPEASPDPNFAQIGRNLWQGEVNWRTALNYDAFQTIRTARSIASIIPNSGISGRIALAKTIGNSGFQSRGSTGTIKFLPSGDRNAELVLLKVAPGQKSKTGYDFVPL